MDAGAVVREAWSLYKAHWRHLLPISFVVYLLLSLFILLLVLLAGGIGLVAAGFVSLAGIFWIQGALVLAVQDIRDGRADLPIGETISRVRPRVNTLGMAGILAALAIVIGLAFFIVPGLVLFTWWLLLVPVIMLEGAGVRGAFGRSRKLVRGYGWSAFGVIVRTVLVLIVVDLLVRLAFLWLPEGLEEYAASVAANTLTAPFIALAFTLTYYRLRETRESATTAAM